MTTYEAAEKNKIAKEFAEERHQVYGSSSDEEYNDENESESSD
jgi:hypothetical protein